MCRLLYLPLHATGNPIRSTVWFNVIGEEVLDSAFKWTNQIDPSAKLIYNDYGAETMNSKSNAVYALVSRLKSRNVPIHGVGFQSHIGYTTAPTMTANWIVQADQNIKRLGALGLQVSITELDLGIPAPFDATKYAQQATSYGNILRLALRNSSIVKTFTLWGFTDKYSWIPGFSNYKNGAALIFYDDFTPKPAYDELVSILKANCPLPTNCTASISPNGPTSFCAGGNVDFSTNIGASYQWKRGTTVVSSSSVYTATSSGSFTVDVTYTNGCKATSPAVAVTVNPLPIATITASGTTNICPGNSVTLTANTSSTYSWKRNGTTVGVSRSFVANTAGNYWVDIVDANGCKDSSPITSVSVLGILQPNVSITCSATTVCSGTGVTFTATGVNGGTAPTYTWFRNNLQIGTGRTITITPSNGDQIMARLTAGGTLPA
ncbi:MAG: endo-1,4-beta-xylanase, partial [Cytophagales bacterium]|nr:endo-1,4-beta-xylanase [Cytophagales bacterium]